MPFQERAGWWVGPTFQESNVTTVLRSNTTTPAAGYAAVAGGAAKSRAASPSCIIRVLGAFAFEFPQSFPEEDNPWRRAHARRLLQIVGSAPRMSESRAKVLAALWPDFDEQRARNRLHHTVHWIRKGLEAYLTVLMEQLWPKKRILDAYLNLVDWGDGIFGAQAASRAYFGTDAGSLTGDEAARLAAILPNPHKWKAAHPGHYVARRSGMLRGRERMVARDGLNFCVK